MIDSFWLRKDSFDRKIYIDVAKGILIICVVIGHVFNFEYFFTATIKTVIYSFPMPAFFIISGILVKPGKLENQSLRNFLGRRTKRLIIPYVMFEIIGGVFLMFLIGSDKVNPVGILYGIITLHCHVGADWFLPTLFLAELIFFICFKNIGRKSVFFMAVLSFVIAFAVQDRNYTVAVIRRILVAFGFIVLGYLFRGMFTKKKEIGIVISFFLILCISYCNGVVDLSARTFNIPVLYVFGGVAGTYFVLDISRHLSGRTEKILAVIGQNSLVIMGTHQHVMLVTNVIYGSLYLIYVQIILLFVIALYELAVVTIYHLFFEKFLKIKSKGKLQWKKSL